MFDDLQKLRAEYRARWKNQNPRGAAAQERAAEYKQRYYDYLKSDAWFVLRAKVLDRDHHICQACLTNKATAVHHLTYQNVFNENAWELVSICKNCHDKFDGIKKVR